MDKRGAQTFDTATATWAGGGPSLLLMSLAAIPDSVVINTIWVFVAGVLVMFMQAGF
ncbi:MAG: hypothetical protein JWM71_2404, partial [Solirubrobacteraceae bacterium]|nr:hypothetical protein [Solirubrobacteraceae bacterium]